MEKKVFLWVLFCIIFILGTGSVKAGGCNTGAYNYTCGDTIYESCTMNDNLDFIGTCFTVGSDNIVIDGNGFKLSGNNDSVDYYYGISISNKDNITIKNIIISNFHNAINIYSSNKINIINSTLIYNDQWGVLLNTSSNSLVENCFIAHSKNQALACGGLFIYKGEKNVINSNNFTNGSGIMHYGAVRIQYSNHNNITNNRMEHTVGWGVDSQHSNFTRVESNYMYDIGPAGGPYIHGNSFNCGVINNTLDDAGGILFHTTTEIATGSGHLIKGNKITDASDKGIEVIRTHGTIMIDNYIEDSDNIGIRFWGSFDCKLIDSQIYNSATADVVSETITYEPNNTLINTTFTSTDTRDGTLYVKWYMDVYVNDSSGNPVENAYVTAYDINSNLNFNEITNSNGYIERQTVTEYYENPTAKYYLTNYSISATKNSVNSQTESVNLTDNRVTDDNTEVVLTIEA